MCMSNITMSGMPSRSRSRSRSPEQRDRPLPLGVSNISEGDYFLKSAEFRVWLKDKKRKYFDELSGKKARSYFRKFVKAWNSGTLPDVLYSGNLDSSAQSATAYKWSFASRSAVAEPRHTTATSSAHPGQRPRVHGPTAPTNADLVLAREDDALAQQHSRKRDRAAAAERLDDALGGAPERVGREGTLERKRVRREADRAFRDARQDQDAEVAESTLMGGGDSFRDRIARRDAARRRAEAAREDKTGATRERATAMREKDKATMDMLQQLAKQRFG